MKQKLTPQEKKKLSLERDHVVLGGENDKAFRKKWPRKKANSTRAFRHKVNAAVSHATEANSDEQELKAKDCVRLEMRKWGVTPLGKAIDDRKQNRLEMHGARIRRRLKKAPQSD
jgi:hypothetical protein